MNPGSFPNYVEADSNLFLCSLVCSFVFPPSPPPAPPPSYSSSSGLGCGYKGAVALQTRWLMFWYSHRRYPTLSLGWNCLKRVRLFTWYEVVLKDKPR